jgi:hypothetical protein
MTPEIGRHFHITDLRTKKTRMVQVGDPEPLPWSRGQYLHSVGAPGTGSQIELDGIPAWIKLGILTAHHNILFGEYPEEKDDSLPPIGLGDTALIGKPVGWVQGSINWLLGLFGIPAPTRRKAAKNGKIYWRFDDGSFVLGNHRIRFNRIP